MARLARVKRREVAAIERGDEVEVGAIVREFPQAAEVYSRKARATM
jgi:hypothetical protein